jgi:hypothetical protein
VSGRRLALWAGAIAGWSVGFCAVWTVLFIALGTPALLGYLGERETPRPSPP